MIKTISSFSGSNPTGIIASYPVLNNNVITIDASLSNTFVYYANGNIATPKTIEIVGFSTKSSGAVSSDSITLHANTRPGDMSLVYIGCAIAGNTIVATSNGIASNSYYGWKTLNTSSSVGLMSISSINKKMFYMSPLTVDYSNITTATVASSVTFRNVKTSHLATNLLASNSTSISSTSAIPNPSSVVVNLANSISFVAVFLDNVNIASTFTTAPSGYTRLLSANASGNAITMQLSYRQLTATGTEDPGAIGSTAYPYYAQTTILSPINPRTYLNIINVPSKYYTMTHYISVPQELNVEDAIGMESKNFLISQQVAEWSYTDFNPDHEWEVTFYTEDWGETWVVQGFKEAY
jgi:hypothetical protein